MEPGEGPSQRVNSVKGTSQQSVCYHLPMDTADTLPILDYSVLSDTFNIVAAQDDDQTLQEGFSQVTAANRTVTFEHTSHQFPCFELWDEILNWVERHL